MREGLATGRARADEGTRGSAGKARQPDEATSARQPDAATRSRPRGGPPRNGRPPGRSGGRTRRWTDPDNTGWLTGAWVAAGGVLLAALVVALVVTSLRLANRDTAASSRSSALAAARTYAGEVASYDYRALAQGQDAVLRHATPSFRQQFGARSRSLQPLVLQYQGTATADVLQAGVIQATGTQATVVLFVNQTVTSARLSQPQVNHDRMVMTLTRPGNDWLISQVSLI